MLIVRDRALNHKPPLPPGTQGSVEGQPLASRTAHTCLPLQILTVSDHGGYHKGQEARP